VNPGRLRRSPWALFPLDCSRPSSLLKAQGGQAWRAGGAPLKPYRKLSQLQGTIVLSRLMLATLAPFDV